MAPVEAAISPILKEWVPVGVTLKNPANRKAADRGKRSVAELAGDNGGRQAVQRDGFYRPEDGSAEFLTFWTATPRGWAQVSAFAWNAETRAWEPSDRVGPKPT